MGKYNNGSRELVNIENNNVKKNFSSVCEETDKYIDVVEAALKRGKRVDMILTAQMVRPILMAVVQLRNDNVKLFEVGLELAQVIENLEEEKRKADLTSMSFV